MRNGVSHRQGVMMHPQVEEDLAEEMRRREAQEIALMERFQAHETSLFPETYCQLRKIWLLRGLQCCRSRQTLDDLL